MSPVSGRDANAEIMPPEAGAAPRRRTLGEAQAAFRRLPPMDAQRWYRQRESDDEVFGADDPFDCAWPDTPSIRIDGVSQGETAPPIE
ncbi:hypothetical protein [Alloactinosynnema sp. L-07]|uniref:hypothetical protein n=1 Tax=Alloactinosynnema sp. L-07 TaxID=1653480 RepID=UPI00065F02C8|nr:hypothetical protein [Alloactinosynnema sp. L-07]CRK55856.1 hypothetical protein [Alloactinosynnema sp. L-07]